MSQTPEEMEALADLLTQQANAYAGKKHFGQGNQKIAEAKRLRNKASDLRASGYPFAPAVGKTDTSNEASTRIAKKVGKFHSMALIALAGGDKTNSEIFEHFRILLPVNVGYYEVRRLERSLQPRTSDLLGMGRVFDTGRKRKNPDGNNEIIWTLQNPRRVA